MIERDLKVKIIKIIMSSKTPFNTEDIIRDVRKMYGIENQELIRHTLDELCQDGVVECLEVADECYAFVVVQNKRKE